jgi:hypothetical protein
MSSRFKVQGSKLTGLRVTSLEITPGPGGDTVTFWVGSIGRPRIELAVPYAIAFSQASDLIVALLASHKLQVLQKRSGPRLSTLSPRPRRRSS